MYKIYVDGNLLFATDSFDEEHAILSPKLPLETNEAGSLSFTLPPGHVMFDAIRKLKSIITVERGGKVIFRGRATEAETDNYNQKNVYCEGDLAFLGDSIYAPGIYHGKIRDYFILLIEAHNQNVDPEKRFTVGVIDAVDADKLFEGSERMETRVYWDTHTIIHDKLLGPYGGYLRTRTEDGITYIDWLKKSGGTNGQVIQFGVNLLDIKDKIAADGVFTILIPQGYTEIDEDGNYSDPVSVASVNGGLDYIQNDEAVARFGKIWRTKTWDWIEDPAKLLEKGREYLNTGIEVQTLTLKAIDMHFIDGSAEAIQIGDYVRIVSDPHGLDITLNCTKIDIDLLNPENTTYTFGEPPRTLTDNIVRTEDDLGQLTGGGRGGGGGRSIKDEASDILRWARIVVDEANANINLNAGEINKLEGRMNTAEINIDGANANITLNATAVNELDGRVSSAEIEIDGLNSEITLKADKIDLQGYVTATKLQTELANLEHAISDEMYITTLGTGNFNINGYGISLKQKTVVVSVGLNKEYASVPASNGSTYVVISGATISTSKETMYYLSWE